MIKLFRKIRQELLVEGSRGKYIKYAIGEIILVVIGILIALQINNWNENRKKTNLKRNYAINLLNDLKNDTLQLRNQLTINEENLKKIDSFQLFMSKSKLTTKELSDSIMSGPLNIGLRVTNTYNNNTFNILASSGNIDLFDNEFTSALMELNRLQLDELKTSRGNRDHYFDGFGSHRALYLYLSDFVSKEHLFESLNSDYDYKAYLKFYINSILIQRHSIRRYIEKTNNVLHQTEKVLTLLEEEYASI